MNIQILLQTILLLSCPCGIRQGQRGLQARMRTQEVREGGGIKPAPPNFLLGALCLLTGVLTVTSWGMSWRKEALGWRKAHSWLRYSVPNRASL